MHASSSLTQARQLAGQGRFDDFLLHCQQMMSTHNEDPEALLSIGSLLLAFGFLSIAHPCFARVRELLPNDVRPLLNLANVARDAGRHEAARRIDEALLARLPDHPVIRRNALLSLEYDPAASDAERLQRAQAWGKWAIEKAGGMRARPALLPLSGRLLRIGYVSADFCQHTVGWFIKDVLAAHDVERVQVFAYSAGRVRDWISDAIRASCVWRDVAALDDAALAALIQQDQIDVLVDLSGHTAGSRLSVFAHRPAPVQVSWLGYFASTGLSVIDAVLLDEWHAPAGTEAQFVEPIIRLRGGRFCYTPAPFAPAEVAPLPCLQQGCITFGCFNNTAKLHVGVYATWARILAAVPNSRLILKWRTLQDPAFSQSVRDFFVAAGIEAERIILRGASFHGQVLKEYADVDIALDSFPFTGGLTSCEALWMGVPVVTWPQSRVVSRQTLAFLSAIGLPELAARDEDDYVRIAVKLANDVAYLQTLRRDLRSLMRASSLCDVKGFTRALEKELFALFDLVVSSTKTKS